MFFFPQKCQKLWKLCLCQRIGGNQFLWKPNTQKLSCKAKKYPVCIMWVFSFRYSFTQSETDFWEIGESEGFCWKVWPEYLNNCFAPPNFFCPSLNLIEKQVVYIVDSLVDICTLILSPKENTNVDFNVLHIFACICRQVLRNKNLNSCQFVLPQCMC